MSTEGWVKRWEKSNREREREILVRREAPGEPLLFWEWEKRKRSKGRTRATIFPSNPVIKCVFSHSPVDLLKRKSVGKWTVLFTVNAMLFHRSCIDSLIPSKRSQRSKDNEMKNHFPKYVQMKTKGKDECCREMSTPSVLQVIHAWEIQGTSSHMTWQTQEVSFWSFVPPLSFCYVYPRIKSVSVFDPRLIFPSMSESAVRFPWLGGKSCRLFRCFTSSFPSLISLIWDAGPSSRVS